MGDTVENSHEGTWQELMGSDLLMKVRLICTTKKMQPLSFSNRLTRSFSSTTVTIKAFQRR